MRKVLKQGAAYRVEQTDGTFVQYYRHTIFLIFDPITQQTEKSTYDTIEEALAHLHGGDPHSVRTRLIVQEKIVWTK